MTSPTLPPKPLPEVNDTTRPFWDGAKEGRLVLQRTRAGHAFFYPRPLAPGSWDDDVEWFEASGRGRIYSFTVDRRGSAPAFAADVPYVIAIVELEEGPHMAATIVGCPIDEVRVDMPVEAVFDPVDENVTLVRFRPTRE